MIKQLENKTFKEMIKRHEVKQVFSLLEQWEGEPFCTKRIYVSTTAPVKMYKQLLVLQDVSCYKSVNEIDERTYNNYWQSYLENAKYMQEHADFYYVIVENCKAIQNNPKTPMSHKKFWKIRADAICFMLKDKRIQEANNVSN